MLHPGLKRVLNSIFFAGTILGIAFYSALFFFWQPAEAASRTLTCNGTNRTLTVGVYTDVDGTTFESGSDLTLDQGSGACTFTITLDENDSAISLASLTVESGVTLTHAVAGTGAGTYNWLGFTVSGNVDIQSGATIDVDGKGYLGGWQTGNTTNTGRTNGNTTTGGSDVYSGGGHGGRGGRWDGGTYAIAEGFDSITNPTLPGGGGGAFGSSEKGHNGGGVVRINAAGTITVAGDISAAGTGSGSSHGGGGAGGTIYLSASSTLSGAGSITANGGTSSSGATAGGGGGRIALLYGSYTHSGTLTAYGGNEDEAEEDGTAGTIFKKDDGDTNGYLIVDNGGRTHAYHATHIDSTNDAAFDGVTTTAYARLWIESDATSFSATSLQVDSNSYFESDADLTFTETVTGSLHINGGTVHMDGQLTLTNFTTVNSGTLITNSTTTISSGVVGLDTGFAWEAIGDVQKSAGVNIDTLTVTGTLEFGDITIATTGDIAVRSGGTLTQRMHTKTASYAPAIRLTAGGDFNLDSGATINASGKGYLGGGSASSDDGGYVNGVLTSSVTNTGDYGRTTGNTTTGGSHTYSGGSHGGRGGRWSGGSYDIAAAYDSISNPTLPGGGGGSDGTENGRNGGGVIRITATNIDISGSIEADGDVGGSSFGAGGAGGTVYLNASATLSGGGTISADGGGPVSATGAGGGGRIALLYATYTHSGTVSAYGGNEASAGEDGAPGSIYKKDSDEDFGDLVINNGGRTHMYYNHTLLTTIPADDQDGDNNNGYVFENVTVSNYGILDIPTAIDSNNTGGVNASRKFFASSCTADNDTASDGEITHNTALYASGVATDYVCVAGTVPNDLPAVSLGTPSQNSAGTVSLTATVTDADDDATILIVEHSTDGSTWASSTLATVTETEGQGGVTTSTGQISGIDTDNDGSVSFTAIEWNIEANLPDTDDTSVYLRFIPNDSIGNGTTVTSSAFAIDTADPTVPSFVNAENVTATSIDLIYPSTTSTDTNFVEYKIFSDTTAGIDGTEPSPITSSTNANLGDSNFNGNSGSSFTAGSLTPNTTYYLNIFAYDTWGFSTSSATESSTTTLAAVPTSLATSVTTTSQIAVSWNANSNPAGTTYELRLSDNTLVTSTTDVSFTHTGLSVNTEYTYKIRALNSNDQATSYTATVAASTYANAPGTPTAGSPGTSTMVLTLDDNSNSATTTYALYESTTGNYVAADNGLDASTPVWQTTSTWSNPTVSELSPNTQYTFSVVARNGDNVETATTTASALYTLANAPGSPTVTATTSSLSVTLSANSNPAATTYAFYESTSGSYVAADNGLDASTPVWQTTSTWSNPTISGLNINTQYTLSVIARNGDNVETATTTASALYTLAQPADTVTSAASGQTTATVTWGTQSNPTSTQFSLYETNTAQYVNSATLAIGDSAASNAVTSTWFTTADPLTVTGLTASTEYCFAVTGLNGDSVPTATTTATCVTTEAVPVVSNNSNDSTSSSPPPTPPAPSAPTVIAPSTQTISAPPGVPMGVTVGNSAHTVTAGTPGSDGTVSITIQSDPVTISLAPKEEQLIDTNSDGILDFFVRYEEYTDEGEVLLTLSSVYDLEFSINKATSITDEQTVMLYLNSPDASLVAVSNDATFADVAFQDYVHEMEWTLTPGDGSKTVYVRFRTADGGTRDTFDTIILAGQGFDQGSTCPLGLQNAYKTPFDSAVYYITDLCTKRPFARANVFFTYFDDWSDVEVTEEETLEAVPDDTLGFMPWGPLYDPQYGALVKIVTDPKVYLLLGGEKYWITEEAVFTALNYQWSWIEDIDERLLNNYTTGSEINYTNRHPNYTIIKYPDDPKVYRLEPDPTDPTVQIKRHIADEDAFNALNFRWDRIVTIDEAEVYEEGEQLQ